MASPGATAPPPKEARTPRVALPVPIIATLHMRRAPMISAIDGLRLRSRARPSRAGACPRLCALRLALGPWRSKRLHAVRRDHGDSSRAGVLGVDAATRAFRRERQSVFSALRHWVKSSVQIGPETTSAGFTERHFEHPGRIATVDVVEDDSARRPGGAPRRGLREEVRGLPRRGVAGLPGRQGPGGRSLHLRRGGRWPRGAALAAGPKLRPAPALPPHHSGLYRRLGAS
jgi:hypothetical protein